MRGIDLMCSFNDVISELALVDVPLKNRSFTWSSKRPYPSLSKLDRVFTSPAWAAHFPHLILTALEVIVSDHTPILLTCKQIPRSKRPFRLETFWFRFEEVKRKISEIWGAQVQNQEEHGDRYNEKLMKMHQELRDWHYSNHSQLEMQLKNSKKVISFFDQIEEKRNLFREEFALRQKLRERAYHLASLAAEKWSQRARCRWLAQGDNNTRFFHCYASSRMRRNMVLSLNHNNEILTDKEAIKEVFLEHMKGLLGTEAPVQDFNPTSLYPTAQHITGLQADFSVQEIEGAVTQLAKNKASGPDGLPNEFAQIYWPEIQHEIVFLVQGFAKGTVDIRPHNQANLIMIPKKEIVEGVQDFRPISIINLVPKIISKILASRLSKVLRIFASVSGLTINYGKSSFVPINLSYEQLKVVESVFGCNKADFPIVYLGMPLTIKRLKRRDYMPLIERIERRLQGWLGKFISRGGRLQLMNSVLAEIPTYYMTCFILPKWVINRIDFIRRRFLWGKMEGQTRGISLMNWGMVCTPKRCGGLGAPNLEIRNISLIMRWWWKAQTEPNCLWSEFIQKLHGNGIQQGGPRTWLVGGSFFWQNLIKMHYLFIWSTEWYVGDGASVSFWYDAWNETPLRRLRDGLPRPLFQRISLRDAVPLINNLTPLVTFTQRLTQALDELKWRWTHSGLYSSSSFYKTMMSGGLITWKYKGIWIAHAPAKVKIFGCLLLHNKLLTHEVMAVRHMNCDPKCVMCDNCNYETAQHLFFSCQYANQVWEQIELHLGFQLKVTWDSIEETWDKSFICRTRAVGKKEWSTRFMSVLWSLWRQRNKKNLPQQIGTAETAG